jgi:micrococcal nuclease
VLRPRRTSSDRRSSARSIARRAAAAAVVAIAAPLAPISATATTQTSFATTTGTARVTKIVNGDSLEVVVGGRRERVRLIGPDAPELYPAECQAVAARTYLGRLIAGRAVRLDADPSQGDRDRYGRLLRHVVLPSGKVAAGQVIAAGLAREFTYLKPYRYRATFQAAQRTALSKHLGIWSAACARPPAKCTIKGNISATTGERIYHPPGQRYYAATVIDLRKGERWFCTERQALDAGWRKAKL